MLLPEMAIGLHRERAAIRMPQPLRHGWYIHTALDAPGRKQMPEIVVGHFRDADFRAGGFERAATASDGHDLCRRGLLAASLPDETAQSVGIRDGPRRPRGPPFFV